MLVSVFTKLEANVVSKILHYCLVHVSQDRYSEIKIRYVMKLKSLECNDYVVILVKVLQCQ